MGKLDDELKRLEEMQGTYPKGSLVSKDEVVVDLHEYLKVRTCDVRDQIMKVMTLQNVLADLDRIKKPGLQAEVEDLRNLLTTTIARLENWKITDDGYGAVLHNIKDFCDDLREGNIPDEIA